MSVFFGLLWTTCAGTWFLAARDLAGVLPAKEDAQPEVGIEDVGERLDFRLYIVVLLSGIEKPDTEDFGVFRTRVDYLMLDVQDQRFLLFEAVLYT